MPGMNRLRRPIRSGHYPQSRGRVQKVMAGSSSVASSSTPHASAAAHRLDKSPDPSLGDLGHAHGLKIIRSTVVDGTARWHSYEMISTNLLEVWVNRKRCARFQWNLELGGVRSPYDDLDADVGDLVLPKAHRLKIRGDLHRGTDDDFLKKWQIIVSRQDGLEE